MDIKKIFSQNLMTLLFITVFFAGTLQGFCEINLQDADANSALKARCSVFFLPPKNKAPLAPKTCDKETTEIKRFFEKQQSLLNTSDIEGLKKLYSNDYISNDGFNKETLFKLYADTLKVHPDIKYNVNLCKITVCGSFASVRAENKSTATTAKKSEITGDNGLLTIEMETIFYLKKTGNEWKIVAEQTTSEKTSILYGDCKNSGLELFAPECIPANTEYTATIKLPEKYAKYAMGALKKELITYPSAETGDIFKPFDSIGLIERIFKSNTTGKNETIAASVAFALPKIDKSNNIDIKVSGIGVMLQRVNIMPLEQK